jgi:hypothetical protein
VGKIACWTINGGHGAPAILPTIDRPHHRAFAHPTNCLATCVLAALLLWPMAAPVGAAPNEDAAATPAMAEYRRKLEEYTRARQAFEDEAGTYWNAIAQKRRTRIDKRRSNQEILLDDYVLTHPPVYAGPRRPIDPSAPDAKPPPPPYVPVVADFLKAAADEFAFVPKRPASEIEYMRAYAEVAAAAGLTKDQVVRVYVFEAGGNGTYETQAGLEYSTKARAITTALGYNQLLTTNTVGLLAEHGDLLVKALKAKAARSSGEAKTALERKTTVLRRMVEFTRSVPNAWSEHDKIGKTPKGLGVHALNLDVDVGPLLQTHKLLDSVVFARRKGYTAPLSAAELEMMNLTGDGNGFDMVTMPAAMRDKVPTSNFFQRGGYERNPVASRNNTVAKLLAVTDARMDRGVAMQGAKDLAAAYGAAAAAKNRSPD